MKTDYPNNPLYQKLGIKKGHKVCVIHAPPNYMDLIGEFTQQLIFEKFPTPDLDFIHFFTNSGKELEKTVPQIKRLIKKSGSIWISWYKKSSGKYSELTENIIRDMVLGSGLVDVKVCSIDEDWSGLKFVHRLKDR
jgi:hypothetical protein